MQRELQSPLPARRVYPSLLHPVLHPRARGGNQPLHTRQATAKATADLTPGGMRQYGEGAADFALGLAEIIYLLRYQTDLYQAEDYETSFFKWSKNEFFLRLEMAGARFIWSATTGFLLAAPINTPAEWQEWFLAVEAALNKSQAVAA